MTIVADVCTIGLASSFQRPAATLFEYGGQRYAKSKKGGT
jgi:hypothetical protein